jgi:ABC-type transporter Mla subunit MlaD
MVNRATPEVEKLLVQIRHSTEIAGRMLGNVDTVVVASREDVQQAIAGLSSALQHLDSVLGRVESFVEQKEGQIDSTLNNVHSTSQSARELAARPWKFFTGTSEAEEDPKVTKFRRSKFRSLRP